RFETAERATTVAAGFPLAAWDAVRRTHELARRNAEVVLDAEERRDLDHANVVAALEHGDYVIVRHAGAKLHDVVRRSALRGRRAERRRTVGAQRAERRHGWRCFDHKRRAAAALQDHRES